MTKRLRTSKRSQKRATLTDVAAVAGVSTITVSRALRKPDSVAENTRQTIASAIVQVNYIPNLIAGSLASDRSMTVAAVVPTLGNSIFTEVLQGMNEVLRPANYQLILGNSNYSLGEEEALVRTFLARQVDGVMLTGSSHSPWVHATLKNSAIPAVETWSLPESPLDMNVGFSNVEAARTMTDYLLNRGYRTVAFVSAPTLNNDRALDRLKGYSQALEQRALPVDMSLILERPFGLRSGSLALGTLLATRPDVDAIFFANDTLAVGAILECQRRGWRVPERIAIAGFDDLGIASEILPGLTTVRVYRHELGATAAKMLLSRLSGEPNIVKRVDLGFEIIRRESA